MDLFRRLNKASAFVIRTLNSLIWRYRLKSSLDGSGLEAGTT